MEDGGERGIMMMETGDEGSEELDYPENDDEIEKTGMKGGWKGNDEFGYKVVEFGVMLEN